MCKIKSRWLMASPIGLATEAPIGGPLPGADVMNRSTAICGNAADLGKRRYLLWGTDTVVVAVEVLPAASFAVIVIV